MSELSSLTVPGSLSVPSPGEVQVWWARIEAGSLAEEVRASLAADLDEATLRRAGRYLRPADRDRALAGHALLRRVLAAVVGGEPSALVLGTLCGHCGSTEHGKPHLPGDPSPVEVNLSHSGPVVCVALGGPGVGVGIDVEARRGVEWATLRRSVFTDAEWAATGRTPDPEHSRTDAWSRKEASVKSCGWGLSMPMNQVEVTDRGPIGWSAELTGGLGSANGHDVAMGADVAAAVAVHRPSGPSALRPPSVRYVTLP